MTTFSAIVSHHQKCVYMTRRLEFIYIFYHRGIIAITMLVTATYSRVVREFKAPFEEYLPHQANKNIFLREILPIIRILGFTNDYIGSIVRKHMIFIDKPLYFSNLNILRPPYWLSYI